MSPDGRATTSGIALPDARRPVPTPPLGWRPSEPGSFGAERRARPAGLRTSLLRPPHPASLLPLLVLPLLGHGAALGQEIGIEYGATVAGYSDALEVPRGFGAHFDLPGERVALRLAVSHHREGLVIDRSPCTGLVPPDAQCDNELFDGRGRLTTYGVGLVLRLGRPEAEWRPEVFGLVIGTDLTADFTGRSTGARIGPVTPDGISIGAELGAGVRRRLSDVVGVGARLGIQFPRVSECAADAWSAFCSSRPLLRIAVGARLSPWNAGG